MTGTSTMKAAPNFPDFPKAEFESRYERARKMMDDHGLDALLATSIGNYEYFTGHRSDQNHNDKIRPFVVLLPRNGNPVCFVMGFEKGAITQTTWIEDVRTFNLMKHNEVFESGIRDLGLANARIGCELGREQHLKLSYNDFNDLKARLPEASFVDASEVFLHLRMVKSPEEIKRMGEAARITVAGINQAYSAVKPGMTTIEVGRMIRTAIMEQGGEELPSFRVMAGHDFLREGKTGVPTPRPLEIGDTITVDTGATVGGYTCDICRTAVIGEASQEQKDMYKFVIELCYTCYDAFQPGKLCEDVALTCLEELKRVGRTTQAVGRIGHGVGRDSLEYPSVAVGEKVPFEPGMVFACNPNFTTEFGFFNIEENVVVTEDGHMLLPEPLAPRELWVLG